MNRWRIWKDGTEVSFQDGLVGGKLKIATTHTFDKPLNKGKANEKSAKQQAIEFMERQILLKTRKGYYEVDPKNGKPLEVVEEQGDVLTKFSRLPSKLRFYKPQNSANSYMEKLMASRKALWLRKLDGNMHVYTIDEKSNHQLYSSSLAMHQKDEAKEGIPILARYPHIEAAVRELDLPPKTILLVEICCVAAGGHVDEYGFSVDNRDLANGVRGSLTEVALELQKEHGSIGLVVWDIAFLLEECLMQTWPIGERILKIQEITDQDPTGWVTFPEYAKYSDEEGIMALTSPVGEFGYELVDDDPRKTMIELAKQLGWEGWVVVDPMATYGDRAYNFRGKNDRPKECVKDKPKREADFIVRYDPKNTLGGGKIGKPGKGRKSVGVGSVQAYLMHPEHGEIEIASVGNGLEEEDVLKYADPKLYPMVWEVEFEDWTKTGSLTHPRFVRPRDDKQPEECGVDQNPDWETHYAQA
jgi:hypothetical protein